MKKIGIITILKVGNYGAELQAFALQQKLNLLGYKAEIIDYLFYKHDLHKAEPCSRPFYKFPLKKRIKEYLLPILNKIRGLQNIKAYQNRVEAFNTFHNKNTCFSEICYNSYSELYNNPPSYDIYCVGSDQVWNPNCYTSLNPYFLTFAPDNSQKISYASSFGVSSIPSSTKPYYKAGLSRLNSISVREKAGISLIKDITGKDAALVVDPTLLLTKEEWLTIASTSKVPAEPYILLYVLKDSQYITDYANYLSAELNIKVVRLCKEAYVQDKKSTGIQNIIDGGPDDYLGLFANASYVLTNSFHGTVFSILFEKQFATILPQGKDNNSRQIGLLSMLNLESRLLYEGVEYSNITAPINYNNISTILDGLRDKSINYLTKSIESNES